MAKRRPPSPEAKTTPKPALQKCKYCRGKFRPTRTSGKPQKFCTDAHRKLYWRYGALPFDKLVSRMRSEIKKQIASELSEIRRDIATLQHIARLQGVDIHTREVPQ